jgi:NAD(P)-dependent dehydrogenase (short-subunit alcohol dehydrogenase family)
MSWLLRNYHLGGRVALVASTGGDDDAAASAELLQACGAHVVTVAGDELPRALERIEREHGRLDVLVNSADGSDDRGDDADELWLTYERRVVGYYGAVHASLPLLVAASGAVVNLAAADLSLPAGAAAERAATSAVVGLTRALACELGPRGIRVNCVAAAPGCSAGAARAVLFLSTPAAAAMSGAALVIDDAVRHAETS